MQKATFSSEKNVCKIQIWGFFLQCTVPVYRPFTNQTTKAISYMTAKPGNQPIQNTIGANKTCTASR